MNRFFLQVNAKNFCYRKKGNGPYLFLLHPSPRSSTLLVPMMELLCHHFTCIAPDLPGYGNSEQLDKKVTNINDYVPWLNTFIEKHTKEPIYLYGTATGAQLAIAYANTYPNLMQQLYLDNCAHFTSAERKEILQHYFIDLTPKEDGSHLTTLWQHVQDSCIYFPWYKKEEAYRISNTLPPLSILQAIYNDYLLAGENYADAYKAAFQNEDVLHIQSLQCTTTVFRWLGSPLLSYMNRIAEQKLPSNVKVLDTPKELSLRYNRMQEIMTASFLTTT